MRILQNIIQNNYLRVGLESKDGEFLTSENILMVSPFIRSVLNSLQSVSETVLILPDFSRAEVEKCLNLLEYKAGEDLVFSGTTKRLLETIGVDLKNIKPLERNVKPKVEDNPARRINIKAEKFEENVIYIDEDEDEEEENIERNKDSDSDEVDKLLADSDSEDNMPANTDELAGLHAALLKLHAEEFKEEDDNEENMEKDNNEDNKKEDDNEDNTDQGLLGEIPAEPQSDFG